MVKKEVVVLALLFLALIPSALATIPDPGHDISSVGGGNSPAENYNFTGNVTAHNFFGYINWSWIQNPVVTASFPTTYPWANITGAPTIPTVPSTYPLANITDTGNLDTDSTNDITTSGGTITGDLNINGILRVVGSYVNLTVTNEFVNGSIIPSITNMFNIGNPSTVWQAIYATTFYGNLNASYITNAPWLTSYTESDPIAATDNTTQAALINARALPGTCPSGQLVQNTTTGGVQCVAVSFTDTDTWNTTAQMQLAVAGNITALQTDNTTQAAAINAKASPGTCPAGQVVQNTTTGGVQCIAAGVDTDTWNTTAQMQLAVSGNLTALQTDNTTQAGLISALRTDNTTQGSELSALRTDNTTQAAAINAKASPGTCAAGQVVQNTTTGGVQCVAITSTDTNESARVNNITGTDCGAGWYAGGFDSGGTIICYQDQIGAPGTTDGNNYTKSIGVSGTTTKTLNLERDGMVNLTASWTDIDTDTDTWNTTQQMRDAITGTENLTKSYCGNITGATANLCTITQVTDTDTWNTTAQMRNAVNNSGTYNISINASNILNAPWITSFTDTWNTTWQMQLAVAGNITALQTDNTTQAAAINAKASPGTCSAGYFTQNTTTGGVQCLQVNASMITNAPWLTSYTDTDTWNTTAQMQLAVSGNLTALQTDNTTQAGQISALVASNTSQGTAITNLQTDNTTQAGIINTKVTIGSANQTLSYCGNITGAAANLCTITQTTDTDTWNTTAQMQLAVSGNLTALQTDNTTQASLISALRTDNTTQASQISALQTDNTTQATAISAKVSIGAANQTLSYCGNITGAAANLCTITQITDTDTWNTTAQMRNAVNNSGTYNISINASNILNAPWITSFTDTDTWNTTWQMQLAVSGNLTALQTDNTTQATLISALRTDNTTQGSELSALRTDNTTQATIINTKVTIGSANQTLSYCGNITGATANLCTITQITDTDTWNTTAQMRAAVNNSGTYNISINASMILNAPWLTSYTDTDTWNTTAQMRAAVNNSGTYNISINASMVLNAPWLTSFTESNPTTYPAANITAGTFPAGNFIFTDNVTADVVKFTSAPTTNMIYDNSTCTIIKGPTASIEIC